ncbi:MAG: phosphoribosyltransferase family protein [Candidatus Uhrbacteria bacterium]|nr:phosphoribosyltransferase family protein [Candidatus Uhrbacteria bacterium]
MLKELKIIYNLALDAVFPRFCVNCGSEGSLLCHVCAVDWSPMPPKFVCIYCGNDSILGRTCCIESIDIPDGHIATFHYADSIVKGLIRAWKFHYDQSAWRHLQAQIATRLVGVCDLVSTFEIDAVVPIPLHNRRLCERGFDQALEVASLIGRDAEIPVSQLLIRGRATKSQADKRTDAERYDAMKESPFIVNTNLEIPESVLLIDDVWTTGATARAAVRALREAGVERVWVYTIAKGR